MLRWWICCFTSNLKKGKPKRRGLRLSCEDAQFRSNWRKRIEEHRLMQVHLENWPLKIVLARV